MVQNITDCIGRWIYWIRSAQEIYATEFNLHLWRGWPSRCCGNLRPRRINKQLFIILTVVSRQPDDLLWKKNNSPAHPGRNLSWESSRGTPFLLEGDMLERGGVYYTCCFVVIYRWHDSMDLWINLYESLRSFTLTTLILSEKDKCIPCVPIFWKIGKISWVILVNLM